MSISPRDAIVLGALLGPAALSVNGMSRTLPLTADDRARLAAQFGMSPAKIDALVSSLISSIIDGARLLDECQPRDVKRCPHCCAVIT